MDAPYTLRQGQYLAFIATYSRLRGQAPSEAEIANHFLVSPPTVHQMVLSLERRGLIQRTPGQARALKVLLPPSALPDLFGGQTQLLQGPTTAERYPHLARWIAHSGWVELGRAGGSGPMARAVEEAITVWAGKSSYADLDEVLRDLDEGIARWMEENTS